MKKDDDAVSVVVALMLILAIISICIATYTTTYLPGLVQQDEITHSEDVRYAFERFASDIDNVISLRRNASFTETFALGGGDVILSPSRSSGVVEISDYEVGKLTVDGVETNISAVSVEYRPVNSLWEPQGYLYRNGIVWITKDNKITPSSQTLYTYQSGKTRENETISKWLEPYISYSGVNTTLTLFNMTVVEQKSITGSGFAKLRISSDTTETVYPTGIISVKIADIYGVDKYSGNMNNLTVRSLNIKVSVE